jgi:hypothetical protein
MTARDFSQGVRFKLINEIIGLNAEPLAPGHAYHAAFPIFVGNLLSKLFRCCRGQHHLFVSEMRASLDPFIVIDGHNAKLDVVLRVRLADVYHIEIGRAVSKLRVRLNVVVWIGARDPGDALVRIRVKLPLVKVYIELSSFQR